MEFQPVNNILKERQGKQKRTTMVFGKGEISLYSREPSQGEISTNIFS